MTVFFVDGDTQELGFSCGGSHGWGVELPTLSLINCRVRFQTKGMNTVALLVQPGTDLNLMKVEMRTALEAIAVIEGKF